MTSNLQTTRSTASCSSCGCAVPGEEVRDSAFRKALWIALILNATMFAVEIVAGLIANSVSLQADALDFLGDAANYGISLAVLSLTLRWRSVAALIKGLTMGAFGLWVIARTVWHLMQGTLPSAEIMGAVAVVALAVNMSVAVMLFRFRGGDANMRSVWLCSRNDALVNVSVIVAAGAVALFDSNLPDLGVAAVIALLALTASLQVVRQATGELKAA